MARERIEAPVATKHTVTIYLFVAVGVIVGTIGLVAYLFNGK